MWASWFAARSTSASRTAAWRSSRRRNLFRSNPDTPAGSWATNRRSSSNSISKATRFRNSVCRKSILTKNREGTIGGMQYTRLGDTGLIVSRLAFGAMTFGTSTGMFAGVAKVDEKTAHAMIARTIDAGINHFNTADGYTDGQSEEILGRALGAQRKDVVISTKVGFRTGEALLHQGLSRQHIFAS